MLVQQSNISEAQAAIRMVAIDLDGTLLNDSKQVSQRTIDALACLPARGIRVVLATARPPRGVRHIYQSLGLSTWTINYNGAVIWDEAVQKAVFHRPMSGDLVLSIVRGARAMSDALLVSCEIMDRWHTDRPDNHFTTETGRLFKPDYIGPVESFCDQPITKLMLLGKTAMLAKVEREVLGAFGQKVSTIIDGHILQIMDRRVSKSIALLKLARHYEIPMGQVMAIGDAPNDVGMVQAAGIGVAMDNAHPRVKEMADWVAPSNNDHGVHAALRRYGLCE